MVLILSLHQKKKKKKKKIYVPVSDILEQFIGAKEVDFDIRTLAAS